MHVIYPLISREQAVERGNLKLESCLDIDQAMSTQRTTGGGFTDTITALHGMMSPGFYFITDNETGHVIGKCFTIHEDGTWSNGHVGTQTVRVTHWPPKKTV